MLKENIMHGNELPLSEALRKGKTIQMSYEHGLFS
uniref:Uncharacterized protein n=1 Tax=Arundo donax TaxID=35708 RepID=A0A0A9G0K1_ARUDO